MSKSPIHHPALAAALVDESTGMRAFIVADRLVGGQAMGGIRIAPGLAIDEVVNLARLMNLKLALAELAIGGAKGGIVLDPLTEGSDRKKHLAAFGRIAGPLFRGGVYLGTDLGSTYEDRTFIHECANYSVENQAKSLPCSWRVLWQHCRDVTGYGVAHAAVVAADLANLGATNRRVVIQGFGEVGNAVARHGAAMGLTIVGVADKFGTVVAGRGLPIDKLCAITDVYGTIDHARLPAGVELRREPDAWLDVDADILVLAAIGGAITATNVNRVKAKLLVEGANMPMTHEAIDTLTRAGRHIAPDIIANAGGAIGCGLALLGAIPAGSTPEQAAQWLFDETAQRVEHNLRDIAKRARGEGCSVHQMALELAQDKVGMYHAD